MRKMKEKKKGRKRKERRNKEKRIRREKREEREKGGKRKEGFLGFGRSTFDSSSTKVVARSGIYVWTPKSWSFDKLQEVGYFPTWFTFSLKAL